MGDGEVTREAFTFVSPLPQHTSVHSDTGVLTEMHKSIFCILSIKCIFLQNLQQKADTGFYINFKQYPKA